MDLLDQFAVCWARSRPCASYFGAGFPNQFARRQTQEGGLDWIGPLHRVDY